MEIGQPIKIVELFRRFNEADNALTRYALAAALRDTLVKCVADLDENVLPLYKTAMIDLVSRKE